MPKHKTLTDVRQKLQPSRLDSQTELLADDVDLTQLSFITRHLPPLRFDELVTDGEVTRTIEGASTVQITINDGEGIIRDSGRLATPVDIKLDGLWFRLVKIQKSGVSMTLTFESREVAILRTYNGKRTVGWGKMRRSRFAQILVEEVKEFKIPFICPDLIALKNQKIIDAFLPLFVLPGNWPGLTDIGTIDLEDRPLVKMPDGSVATVRSITIGPESGKYVLIPTVVGHAVVSDADAIAHYNSTNEFLGKFDTEAHADSYAVALHKEQEGYARRRAIANRGIVPPSQSDVERNIKRQEGLDNTKNTNSSTMQTSGGGGVKNQFPPVYWIQGTWDGAELMGNINLNARPIVDNPGGGKVSLRPILYSVPPDWYIIPTVVGNQIVSDVDAQTNFQVTRKQLGKFDTVAHAQPYLRALRLFQTEYIKKKTKPKTQASATDTTSLSARGFGLLINKHPATKIQLDNCEKVLDVGVKLGASHKVLLSAIMTIIDESGCYNLDHGLGTSVGIFQEEDIWGSVERRMNITLASVRYYTAAMKYDKEHPDAKLYQICHAAQGNKDPKVYAKFGNEASAIVTRYGHPNKGLEEANLMALLDTQVDGSQFQFTRGHPETNAGGVKKWIKEDSWTCLQRLANEVNWRCFEVSGTIYWTTDKQLFKSAPRATISEDTTGINWIDFDYDVGKPTSQVSVECYINRWDAPPGSVIEIFDMGPINGRWLVTEINRPVFDALGTITLKKPGARLPEPKQNDATSLLAGFLEPINQYVRTPGRDPNQPSERPKSGRALREAVLTNADISYSNPNSQKGDIKAGRIDARVLNFLLDFTDAGFEVKITALRSDHKQFSRPGHVSAHFTGNAVDMGNFTVSTHAKTFDAMTWIRQNNDKLFAPVDQLIGPIPELCFDHGATKIVQGAGVFPDSTLEDHKDHIHVGFAPRTHN